MKQKIQSWLCKLFGCKNAGKPEVQFNWVIGLPVIKTTLKANMLELVITNEQKVTVTLAPVTATGKPAKLDGAPTWTVQSGDSTVTPSADGLTAVFTSSDTPGDTQVLVEADADLGSGVVTISDIIKLTVQGAQAQSLGLTAAAPEPK